MALGGTKGGLTGAGGAGKSTTEERDLVAGAFFAAATGLTAASTFAGSTATGLGALASFAAGLATSLAGFPAATFLAGAAFLRIAVFGAGADFFSALTTGFFAAGAGFEGLTAGFALPFWGADLVVVFFAAMAQR